MSTLFSLILPTRGRPELLQRLLNSLVSTSIRPETVEVVVVVDADDPASLAIACERLILKQVVVPPGLSMGALNMAGYEGATGRYLMLLNDDVRARTPGWDVKIAACFAAFPDEILLVHVNDTVFQTALCTFPIVSRTFCDLADGICPRAYRRYRIDDHIEDVFNLLGVLGERRIVYLPDVIFEHFNHVTNDHGVRQYFSEPATLALDAPVFDALVDDRKELAVQLKARLAGPANEKQLASWRSQLAKTSDSFCLSRPGRLRVVSDEDLAFPRRITHGDVWWRRLRKKIRGRVREDGYAGLARAVARRMLRTIGVRS